MGRKKKKLKKRKKIKGKKLKISSSKSTAQGAYKPNIFKTNENTDLVRLYGGLDGLKRIK